MNMFQKTDQWNDKHHYLIPDILRMILGTIIFLKGLYFISHTAELQHTLSQSQFPWLAFGIAHYVAMISLAGGVMIAIGCLTRLACALQIPILLGAVLFVNWNKGIFGGDAELLLSILVLVLLVFYFFYGSGVISADHALRSTKPEYRAAGGGKKVLGT
jgi:uncharacterized membrane protein YphA (DoxX/SURF4 family)